MPILLYVLLSSMFSGILTRVTYWMPRPKNVRSCHPPHNIALFSKEHFREVISVKHKKPAMVTPSTAKGLGLDFIQDERLTMP